MKLNFAKALLYAYPHVEKLAQGIEIQIKKKAHKSVSDIRPVEKQANEIIDLIEKRYLLRDILEAVEDTVGSLKKEYQAYIAYRYFGKPLEVEVVKDRQFYRKIEKLVKHLATKFDEIGVDDKYFEEEYMKVSSIRHALEKVVDEEYKRKVHIQAMRREKRKQEAMAAEAKDV